MYFVKEANGVTEEDKGFYREIITKAVCGEGKKFQQTTHTVTPPNKPTSILGCWIINHKYKANPKKDEVLVNGTYDINIWYSYKDNTKTEVVTETVQYNEKVPLQYIDQNSIDEKFDVVVRMLQEPNCLEATISPDETKVVVQIEKETAAEIIGETKVAVFIQPNQSDEDSVEEILNEQAINEDFLTTKKED